MALSCSIRLLLVGVVHIRGLASKRVPVFATRHVRSTACLCSSAGDLALRSSQSNDSWLGSPAANFCRNELFMPRRKEKGSTSAAKLLRGLSDSCGEIVPSELKLDDRAVSTETDKKLWSALLPVIRVALVVLMCLRNEPGGSRREDFSEATVVFERFDLMWSNPKSGSPFYPFYNLFRGLPFFEKISTEMVRGSTARRQ